MGEEVDLCICVGGVGADVSRMRLNAARRGIGARGAVEVINYIGRKRRACRWVLAAIRGIVRFWDKWGVGESAKKGIRIGVWLGSTPVMPCLASR